MRKIYSPLLEGILAFYLGFEWIQVRSMHDIRFRFIIRNIIHATIDNIACDMDTMQTDNILAPMITHGIYSTVVLGHGLWKIHDHRRRLRQRIQQVRSQGSSSDTL
jgi:hypothetical protein